MRTYVDYVLPGLSMGRLHVIEKAEETPSFTEGQIINVKVLGSETAPRTIRKIIDEATIKGGEEARWITLYCD